MSHRSSCRRSRRLAGIGAAIGLWLLSGGWIGPARSEDPADAEAFWEVGVPRPIAVRGGRATFRVPTGGRASQTLVVVSALARSRGPFPIRLTARPATTAAIPELASDGPRCAPVRDANAPARAKAPPPSRPGSPADRLPPRDRDFHLMVREGDPGSPSNYVAVRGVLRGVGRRVQVYVASEDIGRVPRGTLEDLITTFDDRIYPRACASHGAARDVDGDGRFTILLSSWLDHLGGGRHAVDGFVKVADLDATMAAPFGNRCDMMYLNASLPPGAFLRTVLAHEYMHAVVYTRKTLDQANGDEPGPEEEGWLDEALAHLAEDFHGFGPSNIDYRVSAFLSRPEQYQLVVDDYFAANLFRSHGNRGSTYLFLRWCVDRYGPELIPALLCSPRCGVANVEGATGSTFASLFRRWSLALFLSGLDPADPSRGAARDGFRSANVRTPWSDWEMIGPRYGQLVPGDPADCWDASGTSSHYVVVEGDRMGAVEIEVAGPPAADIQVTALPLGEARARMTLSVQASRGRGDDLCLRARAAEHNGVPVRLSALSWEPLIPGPRPRVDGRRAGRLDVPGLTAAFGASVLPARGELQSQPIPLPRISPDTGPIVIKLIGTDPQGRRVTAWADVSAISSP